LKPNFLSVDISSVKKLGDNRRKFPFSMSTFYSLEEKQFFEIKTSSGVAVLEVANFLVKIPFGPFVLKYIVSHYCS